MSDNTWLGFFLKSKLFGLAENEVDMEK